MLLQADNKDAQTRVTLERQNWSGTYLDHSQLEGINPTMIPSILPWYPQRYPDALDQTLILSTPPQYP